MDWQTLISIFAGLGTILATWLLIIKVVVPTWKAINDFRHTVLNFFLDWSGEDARAGRSRVPGVMERLNNIDGQLKNNGGSTIKDAVDRIESKVHRIDKRLTQGDEEFDNIYNELEELKKIMERRKTQEPIAFFDRRTPTNLD